MPDFGGVFDKSAAGVSVLRRVGRSDDLHLLNALGGRRTFMALLVTYGITKGSTIEEILRCHGLPAVDARVELAAAEHGIAVRLHRQIAGLDLQHGLGEADVGGGDDGDVFGYAVGHQQSHESSAPAESIQEMKAITTTYSAQYGHTSGEVSNTPPNQALTSSTAALTNISPMTR